MTMLTVTVQTGAFTSLFTMIVFAMFLFVHKLVSVDLWNTDLILIADIDYILASPYQCKCVLLNQCVILIVPVTRGLLFAVPLPQLYLTSFLSIINCRKTIFERKGTTQGAQDGVEVNLLTCSMFVLLMQWCDPTYRQRHLCSLLQARYARNSLPWLDIYLCRLVARYCVNQRSVDRRDAAGDSDIQHCKVSWSRRKWWY